MLPGLSLPNLKEIGPITPTASSSADGFLKNTIGPITLGGKGNSKNSIVTTIVIAAAAITGLYIFYRKR